MIEVALVAFGCVWDSCGHVRGWPLRIQFGQTGPEVTVDQMLEGRGHTLMRLEQLVELVRAMVGTHMLISLKGPVPASAADLSARLVAAGYRVELC